MDRIKYLLLLVLREEASPAEQAELEAWAQSDPANRELMQELQDPALVAEALAVLDGLHRMEAWEQVANYAASHRTAAVVPINGRNSSFRGLKIFRWSAAAAFLALLGTGAWWVIRNQKVGTPAIVATKPADVPAPTGSRATLTLGSGQQIILDSASSGAVVQQGNAQVVKGVGGQLSYRIGNVTNHELIYNTLTNPRGSQVVALTMSDGTRVWLNAESSIRYPVVFTGSDRSVEMTGEAYYEVAKNAGQPFKVETKDNQVVRVLGTSFNINAYPDEAMTKTTLLDGSIAVEPLTQGTNGSPDEKRSLVLKPGQQAWLSNETGHRKGETRAAAIVNGEDIAKAMAWKNGLFAFSDADLPTVMRQLSRWYNVDVKYEGEIPKDKYQFNGKIGKTLTLDQVLKILTKTQVHYSIEGNQLTIRP